MPHKVVMKIKRVNIWKARSVWHTVGLREGYYRYGRPTMQQILCAVFQARSLPSCPWGRNDLLRFSDEEMQLLKGFPRCLTEIIS